MRISADRFPAAFVEFVYQMEVDRERRRGDLSRHFPDGLRWRYFKSRNGRGQEVLFCWSTTKNTAGKHLCWREVVKKSGTGKRDSWQAVSSSAMGCRLSRTRLREHEEARR